jgi:hypothetical protein
MLQEMLWLVRKFHFIDSNDEEKEGESEKTNEEPVLNGVAEMNGTIEEGESVSIICCMLHIILFQIN